MPKTEMYTTKDGRRRFQVAAPISQEAWEAIRELAHAQDTTIAAQVRKAVEEYVARRRSPRRRI